MAAIGITGGVATGKSTFCGYLRELFPSATFFDADQAAHELTTHDLDVRELLSKEFGPSIYSSTGDLNRVELRAIIFDDAEKKRALEQILHPRIRRQWSSEAESRRNSSDLFFADIPLLYETGGETLCDSVVVVACSKSVQLERLRVRTQLERTAAEKIINSQMSLTEKIHRADHVVWNNDGHEVLFVQAQLLAKLWQREIESEGVANPAGR